MASSDRGRASALQSLRFLTRGEHRLLNLGAWTLAWHFIPVAGPIIMMGYLVEMHQRLEARHPRPLPVFRVVDISYYFGRGVAPFVATMVYSVPGVLLMLCFAAATWVVGLDVLGSANPRMGPETWLGTTHSATCPERLGWLALGTAALAVVFLASQLPGLASRLLAERTGDLGVAISPKRVWAVLTRCGVRLFVVYATFYVLCGLLIAVGSLAFCMGALVASAGLRVASSHLRWQLATTFPPESAPAPGPSVLPSEGPTAGPTSS